MSDIKIDNPQRLLALAEQMDGFKKAFEYFIENLRIAVKTTMDHLTKLKIVMKDKIREVNAEISALQAELSAALSDKETAGEAFAIQAQIMQAKRQRSRYKKHLKKIEKLLDKIDYRYKREVKPLEQKILEITSRYPKGIEGLIQMEALMKQYLTFSSSVVKTSLKGDYGGFKFSNQSNFSDSFSSCTYSKDGNGGIISINYGRLKGLGGLTDQMLTNAELGAQKKNAKYVQFEIGSKDKMLCEKSGYSVFSKNGRTYANKDLHSEIDLKGGLFKRNKEYKL